MSRRACGTVSTRAWDSRSPSGQPGRVECTGSSSTPQAQSRRSRRTGCVTRCAPTCALALHPPAARLQEQLDGDLLVFSPYPSLSKWAVGGGHAWARPGGRSRRLHLRLRNVERARRQLPAGALSNLFPALLPAATINQQPTTHNPSRRFLSNSGLAGNQKACEAAWSILSDSYRTPLHLLHPPHVLALGALCLAATITQLDLRSWLDGLTADFQTVGGWVPATLRWLGVG